MKTDRELLELAARPKRGKHGMNKSPEHRVWVGMKQRCNNPKKKDYKWYGAKGVKVCQEWMDSFSSFLEHVGRRPSPQHTIDRINVDGNFEPGMSWDNYGKRNDQWSIDHTRPISSFPMTTTLAEINALENLRPMWHRKNCAKKNKWEGR